MFNENDLIQFREKGITAFTAEQQMFFFRNGFPFANIISPATIERGISKFDKDYIEELIKEFDSYEGEISKFVPASGAATRMFRELYDILINLENGGVASEGQEENLFFEKLENFAFYDELRNCRGFNINNKIDVLKLLLFEDGLNYGSLPKGLIQFHRYNMMSRTPFEEHLLEASEYAKSRDGVARMIATVSTEHLAAFSKLYEKVKESFQEKHDTHLEVSFTIQKPSSDTIAVDENNEPFRKPDGSILFRPGGHGALIENLNEIESPIVFIKNIDNVAKETLLPETVKWKKVLGGALIKVQRKIFDYLKALDGEYNYELLLEISDFMDKVLCIKLPSVPDEVFKDFIREKLNRPIRVCGMVKNTGEPGGGPFIVRDADGSTSLQILESAQLNTDDPSYKELLSKSTHFNPVDIACSFINYCGEKFDLREYVDPETGFISNKSIGGKPIKAQELPGLWNGAMSQWNTIFIEVPIVTFNPVKTVFDLLRKEHQA